MKPWQTPLVFEFFATLEPNRSSGEPLRRRIHRVRTTREAAQMWTVATVRNHDREPPKKARITMVRCVYGRMKELEDDNLPSSLKHVRDGIAMALRPGTKPGQADSPKYGLWFECAQERIEPPRGYPRITNPPTLVRVTIEELQDG